MSAKKKPGAKEDFEEILKNLADRIERALDRVEQAKKQHIPQREFATSGTDYLNGRLVSIMKQMEKIRAKIEVAAEDLENLANEVGPAVKAESKNAGLRVSEECFLIADKLLAKKRARVLH